MKKISFYVIVKCIFLIILIALQGPGLVKASEEYGLVLDWGGYGFKDGKFNNPNGIAVDKEGNVFVSDENCRIQKFSPDGEFITSWGNCGVGEANFFNPVELATDDNGNVYALNYLQVNVSDIVIKRFCNIQKFTSEGDFITKWGSEGTEDGQIFIPTGLAVDSEGNVFVADFYADLLTFATTYYMKCRIQKFTSEGELVEKWETEGSMMDFELDFYFVPLNGPLAVDSEDSLCFLDLFPFSVRRILPNGEFTAGWEYLDLEEDIIPFTSGMAMDGADNVYVTFTFPGYIKKFTSEGELITRWNLSLSTPVGQFGLRPMGWKIAANIEGEIYHVDGMNHRIQKYAQNGQNNQVCFAEKLYGQHSKEVELLRHFRDNVLSSSAEGKEIIKIYYEWNPQIVKTMEVDENFKNSLKGLIDKILPVIK